MNDKLEAWTVETADLTARVAAAIGSPPPVERELLEDIRLLRRELADLRATVALLGDEVVRLRASPVARRIVPFGPAEARVRLS